ncbi:LCP family protein [Bacillus piscicola]|uniref:LCP family protein n=1 Tax=Bacillus piscicola TaxID=1632684 RepID=UPI001F097296|nr:LCP family protein [Bacillus piscicola]
MRTRQRRRSHKKKIITLTFMIIVLAFAAVFTAYTQNSLFFAKKEEEPTSDFAADEKSEMKYDDFTQDTEEKTEIKENKTEKGLNFLLVGVDDEESGGARTDTILLAHLKPKSGEVKLASIMRDSYVEIPGHQNNKINASFAFGGIDLLRQTIEENFDIPIDYYATVNFDGFVEVADTVAPEGLEIDIEKRMYYSDHSGNVNIDFYPGTQHLNGEQLLKYVRFRSDSENDFGRVARQQQVLKMLKDELLTVKSVVKVPQLIGAIRPNLDTDVPTSKMLSLGKDTLLNPVENIETIRIPADDTFIDQRYSHAGAVLELDMEKNKQQLREFFHETPEGDQMVSGNNDNDWNKSY